jgi:hypothetical protein
MSELRRLGTLFVVGLAAASLARAEGVDSRANDRSGPARLDGATTVRPVAGGLISVGGSTLRRLGTGSRRWETLHVVREDNLYRVASDESGRVLAAWENDPFIHLIPPARGRRIALKKPVAPPEVKLGFQVEGLEFSPDGRDAIVFMNGRLDGQRSATAVYRIALDGRSGPRLVFRLDDAVRLHTSRSGAIFMTPKERGQVCNHQSCLPIAAIVAYEFEGDGVTQRILLTGEQADVSSSLLVRGSDEKRVALVLELITRRGPQRQDLGRSLLRWRWGHDDTDYRILPRGGGSMSDWLLTSNGDFLELEHRRGGDRLDLDFLDLRRYPTGGGDVQTTSLGALQTRVEPYGLGERSDGSLWLHWGEHLALLSPGKPPRGLDLTPLLQPDTEWAGAHTYVKSPESLWIGLDGRGRGFVRVDLAEADRHPRPWK